MKLYDLITKVYSASEQKYTIHLTRCIKYEGLSYERTDTIHDVDSITYTDQNRAKVVMFEAKAKKHLEIWSIITEED